MEELWIFSFFFLNTHVILPQDCYLKSKLPGTLSQHLLVDGELGLLLCTPSLELTSSLRGSLHFTRPEQLHQLNIINKMTDSTLHIKGLLKGLIQICSHQIQRKVDKCMSQFFITGTNKNNLEEENV